MKGFVGRLMLERVVAIALVFVAGIANAADERCCTRTHNGLDLVAEPGTLVVSPISGTILRTLDPYARSDGTKGVFSGVRIEGPNGLWVELFYIAPLDGAFPVGAPINAGAPLGYVQDVSTVYPLKGGDAMTNHIHIQAQRDGSFIDPTPLFVWPK